MCLLDDTVRIETQSSEVVLQQRIFSGEGSRNCRSLGGRLFGLSRASHHQTGKLRPRLENLADLHGGT